MDKLYYGSGTCSIEATKVVGLEIKYTGAVKIIDKTSNNYYIVANNKKILIFPVGLVEPLTNLFEYTGEFKIKSILASDIDGKRVRVAVQRVMDYPELMDSKAEDMTINSEKMVAGYLHKGRAGRTTVDIKIIKDLHSKGGFYLEDGTPYTGAYHIHLEGGKAMTGSTHSESSEDLYIKRIKTDKLVKTGTTKTAKRTTRRTTTMTGGGYTGGSGKGGY